MSVLFTIIERLPKLGSGCECVVYQLTTGTVLKTYRSAAQRDRAYERQRRAYLAQLAPPTHGKRNYLKSRYGYVSSRAELLPECNWMGMPEEDFDRLEAELQDIGFNTKDLSRGNAGKWRGNYVSIDFGDLST